MGSGIPFRFFDNAQLCFYTSFLNLLEYKPYSDISVTELAAAAGKDRTAFYRNFESKEDLLVRCLHVFLDSASNSVKKPDRWNSDAVSESVRMLYGIMGRNARALKILLGPNSPALARESIIKTINEFWIKTLRNLSIPHLRDDSVLYFSEFLGCCVMASIEFWMGHRDAPARGRMEDDLCGIMMNGMNLFTDRSRESRTIPVEYPYAQEIADAS
jgi:AcrR family transcriptional regulator